jgi:hypothetical protein
VILIVVGVEAGAEPSRFAAGHAPRVLDLVRGDTDFHLPGSDRAAQRRRIGPIDGEVRSVVVDEAAVAESV